jgi:hypothetical protein
MLRSTDENGDPSRVAHGVAAIVVIHVVCFIISRMVFGFLAIMGM